MISVSVDSEPVQVASVKSTTNDSGLTTLEAELEKCSEINKAYDRLNCERSTKHEIMANQYKLTSQPYAVGPVNFYWPGFGIEGNTFEITSSGQPLLHLRILVENTGLKLSHCFVQGLQYATMM